MTMKSILEIGKKKELTEKEIIILDGKGQEKKWRNIKSDSYERKICAYCDKK